MIEILNPLFWQDFMETVVRPHLFIASDFVFNIALIGATFFSVFFYFIAIDGMFIKNKKPYTGKPLRWPKVTIQIPTYNEPVALRCAERCLRFDYPKDKYEIIIGDDSTDKNISKLIDRFAYRHKEVKVTRRGENVGFKAGNLNHMLKYSSGDIIVIFDSDFVPPKNFLREIVKPFIQSRKVGTVQARWDFLNMKQTLVSKLASATLIVYHHLILPLFNKSGVSFLCGSAEAVRKDLLVKLGGWENGSLTEDTEFSIRVMKAGYKNVYLERLSVKGEVPFNFKSFRKQQMRWAYGTTRAYLQHCRDILFGGIFTSKQKLLITLVIFGYITAPLLATLFLSGVLAFATNTPSPIDIVKFFSSLGRNLLLTSGFIVAAFMGLSKYGKLNSGMAFSILLSSLTVGIMISFYVTKGFIKAVLKMPMQWHMVQKKGNEEVFNGKRASLQRSV